MCGLTGILHRGAVADAEVRVRAMASSIRHRGPDDEGFWCDGEVALGFRRLSIVDLEHGAQPMPNEDGTVLIVFNGEIYNHQELRRELIVAGHRFATDHSDTEVLVHGYEQWGEDLFHRLNGMFACAIWDRRVRQLVLARDRLGIKPLYVSERPDGTLVFGSEVRALHASGIVPVEADDHSVYTYFLQQNVWQGRSMFRGVRQLEGGQFLVDRVHRQRRTATFWDFKFKRKCMPATKAAASLREAIEAALKRQLAADVPVMAYLSGGIDSSAIVAGAYRQDPAVRAYSCIFDLEGVGEDRFVDEREFSRAVATHLGIGHIELELPSTALIDALKRTVSALEEPRMGMAYVNYLIAGRVAADSKVVLSGCGGDEILGGYVARYAHVRLPYPAVAPTVPLLRQSLLGRLLRRARPEPDVKRDPMRRMLELYHFPVGQHEVDAAFTPGFRTASGGYDVGEALRQVVAGCPSDNDWDRLLYADAKTYLAGLLMVEDKLSMAHGLETRVPLLDNELIDLALGLDWSLLTDGVTGKKVFRDAIRDWVPAVVADKPKMGFGPPDASWYRGALQPFVRAMLAPERIRARGLFDPAFVTAAIEDHMSGAANRLPLLWSLISFEVWCETYGLYGGDLGGPIEAMAGRAAA